MNGYSQKIKWVLIALLTMLASCATEPYYESRPITPINVSPSDDINIGVDAETTFVWRSTENTHFYEFHIYNQISKDTTQYSRTNLTENTVCEAGLCRLTLAVNLPTANGHAWRVRSANNAGFSEWNRNRFNMVAAGVQTNSTADADSTPATNLIIEPLADVKEAAAEETASSTVSTEAPVTSSSLPAPELMQPIEGVKVATGTLVDFKWRPQSDAVSYDFSIYDSVSKKMVESLTDIAAATLCRTENECRLSLVVSLPEASHAWRVRANFPDDQSPFASSRFSIVP